LILFCLFTFLNRPPRRIAKPPTHDAVAFRVYDLDASGAIEPPELRRFLAALAADNPDVDLDARALDEIVESAFAELALARPGRISPEEWAALAARSPEVISFMTLPKLAALAADAEGGASGQGGR
jgi:hypothetical protein